VVLFGRKKHVPPRPRPFLLQSFSLQFTDSYTYLGVILDSHLKWDLQFKRVLQKTSRASFLVSRISKSAKFGPNGNCLRTLCNSIILSRISYGLPFWDPSDSQLSRLEALYCAPMRRHLALPWSVSRTALLHECAMPPLQLQRSYCL
jgi:hypothetical protein